ncbi:hypothetical protein HBB16_10725 [Pseudonocardia sp. MCCB 268]|nr:hypothetical protein [Pseudonocardia cytotoxica]
MLRVYRVQHQPGPGPAKVAVFHPEADLDEVTALAMWMTWKCAVVNISTAGEGRNRGRPGAALSTAELERPDPPLHERDPAPDRS